MESLPKVYPPSLDFATPERAELATRRTVSVKPTSGVSVNSASSSDIVQFRLPNTGFLAGCYLKATMTSGAITAGSAVSPNSFAVSTATAHCDRHAPDASWIRRMVVKSSDGTEMTNVNNYNHYCSIMNRLENSKEYEGGQGSILQETPASNDNRRIEYSGVVRTALDGNALATGLAGVSLFNGYDEQGRMEQKNSHVRNFVHQFRAGVLDQSKDYNLPLGLMGSGMTLELTCEDVNAVYRAKLNAVEGGNALDRHPATGASIASYSLTGLELVCDLVFYAPEVIASLSSKMCSEGLKIVCENIRQQANAVPQQSNTVILNTHSRSVKSIICGIKNTDDLSNFRREENDYLYVPTAGGSFIDTFQFSVGSELAPANPIKYGAQSYYELQKALMPVVGDRFKISNSITRANYFKHHKTDTRDGVVANGACVGGSGVENGSAIFGINLQSHPELDDVLSGRSASAGSIPISLDLSFSGSTGLAKAQLETFVISDQIVELLGDGSALVSK